MEKWIVKRQVHLGFIKVTVNTGTIIEHNEAANKIVIDGIEYMPAKDLDILKRHGYVEKYSKDVKEELDKQVIEEEKVEKEKFKKFNEKKTKMKIVNSDADEHPIIDISHTRKKPVMKEISNDMEIIKAEETLQERVERKATSIPKMPIVEDDSLGETVSKSLDTKTVIKSQEEYEKIRKENLEKAKETELKLKKEWLERSKPQEFDESKAQLPSDQVVVPVKKKRGRKPKAIVNQEK